jgi:hypothetical protein
MGSGEGGGAFFFSFINTPKITKVIKQDLCAFHGLKQSAITPPPDYS